MILGIKEPIVKVPVKARAITTPQIISKPLITLINIRKFLMLYSPKSKIQKVSTLSIKSLKFQTIFTNPLIRIAILMANQAEPYQRRTHKRRSHQDKIGVRIQQKGQLNNYQVKNYPLIKTKTKNTPTLKLTNC